MFSGVGRGAPRILLLIGLKLFVLCQPAWADEQSIERVTVTGLAPPATYSVGPSDIAQSHALTASDLLAESVPSAILSDTLSNPFQQDLYFRGFDASPVLGTPIGLALYQNGTRINERFGDLVLWDMIPSFALRRVDVVGGSNPVFGLNALGGAVVLDMKTGFTAEPGTAIDVSGGSFGRATLSMETAEADGNEAFYLGARAGYDDGWRRRSSSNVLQAYGDYSLVAGPFSGGVSLTLADNFLNENAAIPADDDRKAAFSIPDTMRDAVAFVQGRGSYDVSSDLHVRASTYYRATHLSTANGQALGFAPCTTDPSLLCTEDDTDDALNDLSGAPLPASLAPEGTLGLETTMTNAFGGALEMDMSGRLLGMDNTLSAGVTLDYARTGFRSETALGNLSFQPGGVTVVPIGVKLGGTDWNIALTAINQDLGVYAQDKLALARDLSLEVSLRFNSDRIALDDLIGTALNGRHSFTSADPGVTLVWNASDETRVTLSAGQSGRTPTAAELSCADPTQPCLFPLGFISDPPLKRVVARTVTLGADGNFALEAVNLTWSADAFYTRNADDILFVSSGPLIGSGFFANVGDTERIGADAKLMATWDKFDLHANYAFVDATFRSAFEVPSPFNPGADANGNIAVVPGDRLPNVPASSARIALGYQITPRLHAGVDAKVQSSQFLRGDEANLAAPLPGFVVFDANVDYQLSDTISLRLDAENLFDTHYATFGLYGDPTGGGPLPFTNPRFLVPAPPFGVWAGLRARL